MLRRVTIKKRMRAKLREVKDELQARRHLPVPEQGQWLASVVRGHLAYYAVPGNTDAVGAFRAQTRPALAPALRRRSQRTGAELGTDAPPRHRWLPPARIRCIPGPNVRFDAITQGRSPVR